MPAKIDDFEQPGQPSFWFVYRDASKGTMRRDTEVSGPGQRALHVTAEGLDVWGSGLVLPLAAKTQARRACDVDASQYVGIRFRARGRGSLRVLVATTPLVSTMEGGECKLGRDCYDLPGMDVHLQEQWQNYEIRFCQLFPEGWGQKLTTVDPQRLYALHFRLPERQPHEVWVDDVAYMPHTAELDAQRCGPPCPRDAAPPEAIIDPNQFATVLANAGLELHTFDQSTRSCGPLARRYISYVPKRFQQRSDAPVIIALHGAGASAEAFRNYQTRGRFEALSERDGFILVYANAAPGPGTLGLLPNSGTWYVEPTPVDEVDDFAYLASVLEDLKVRQVISGKNKLYLVGHSIGAGMALATIQRDPETYAGIAAVMPYLGATPALPTTATAAHLDRVFFAYSLADPGLPTGYAGALRATISSWATALGMSASALATAAHVPLADNINEGADYRGAFANATATRNSHAEQFDVASPATPRVALRVIEFDHAGHFWPNPTQDNMNLFVETWGLRNQDIDAADAIWEFFSDANQ